MFAYTKVVLVSLFTCLFLVAGCSYDPDSFPSESSDPEPQQIDSPSVAQDAGDTEVSAEGAGDCGCGKEAADCDCGAEAGDCGCKKNAADCDCGEEAGDCGCKKKAANCDCGEEAGDCGCRKEAADCGCRS